MGGVLEGRQKPAQLPHTILQASLDIKISILANTTIAQSSSSVLRTRIVSGTDQDILRGSVRSSSPSPLWLLPKSGEARTR